MYKGYVLKFFLKMPMGVTVKYHGDCVMLKLALPLKLTITLPLCLFLFAGCGLLDELTQLNLNFSTNVDVPATTVSGVPVSIESPTVSTNITNELDAQGSSTASIESITLEEMSLIISSPSGQTFNFLQNVAIYIRAGSLPEILLASVEGLTNSDSERIDMDTTSSNLRNYLSEDNYQLRLEILTDEPIAQDITLEVRQVYTVDATLL